LRQWEAIGRAIRELNPGGEAEWTVECNPATVSADKARLFRDIGVNRISMGVQSLDEGLLDRLGRVHSRDMVFKSFEILRKAGFDNINLDLMFAIPGQTMDMWRRTLNEAVAFGSEHLSCYEVIYEEDTPLYDQLQAGRFDVNEDLACDMYEQLIDVSGEHGFHQYEVANFARTAPAIPCLTPLDTPSRACRHNLNYWRGGAFHGVGPSATGYVRGERTDNWSNTQLWCEQLESGKRAIQSREKLEGMRRAGEIAAFSLRRVAGWRFHEFVEVTGYNLRDHWQAEMNDLVERGWGSADEGGFRLTRTGLRFADAAAEMFLREASAV
jgi:oxygen-independent coproporphyrinogen-3 oxidase